MMPTPENNTLIKFTYETNASAVVKEINQLPIADKQVEEQIGRTNDALAERQKRFNDLKGQTSSVEALTTAFGKLSQSIVGGMASSALQNIVKGLKDIQDLRDKIAAKKDLLSTATDSSQIKALNKEIQTLEALLGKLGNVGKDGFDDLGNSIQQQAAKAVGLRAELRSLREEIGQKKLAGASQEEIQQLIDKAGELDDTLKDVSQQIANTGSDTRNVEGFVQILGTATATIGGVQAAQELLGDSSEEFQKVLTKLNALLIVSNAVQQIQTAIQRESAGITLVANAQRKIGIALTQLQTAAESEYTVVRYAAVAAQTVLNSVMKASPAGLLLTVIGALVTAVLYFTSTTDDAAEAQKKLNDELEQAIQYNNDYDDVLDKANEKIILRMKLAGAADQQIREQELRNAKNKLENQKQLEQQAQESYDRSKDLLAKEKEDAKKFTGASSNGLTILTEEQRKEAERTIKAYEEINKKKLDLQDKYDVLDLQNQLATQQEIQKFDDDALKQQEQTNQKAIEQRRKRTAELAALNERDRKARLEQIKQELEDQKTAAQEVIDDPNTATGAKLRASNDAFEAAQEILYRVRNATLENDKLTGEERKQVVGKYLSDLNKLEADHSKEINAIIKAGGERDVEIAKQTQEARVKEIEERRGATISRLNDELNANEEILDNTRTTEKERQEAFQDSFNIISALTRQEQLEAFELYKAGKLTYKQYQAALTDAAKKGSEERKKLSEKEFKKKQEDEEEAMAIIGASYNTLNRIGEAFFSSGEARGQRDLNNAQVLYDKKLISEQEFQQRKEQIAKQQAARDKERALFQIGIDLATAIFKLQAAATLNPILDFQIPVLIGEALAASALVLAQKYKKGGLVTGPAGDDKVPAWLTQHEYVMPVEQTQQHRLALDAMRANRWSDHLLNYEMPKLTSVFNHVQIPALPAGAEQYMSRGSGDGPAINNKELAREIAREIAKELPGKMPKNGGGKVVLDNKIVGKWVAEEMDRILYTRKKLNRP